MKVAVSSSVFAALLRRGGLTHLEWLEGCASRLDLDGAVFALADFPRTDVEYAAQIKKVATDLGIVPVALDVPQLLDPEQSESMGADALALATAIGAALIRVTAGPPGELPPQTFARTVEATKRLASAAKAANVTLIVAPAGDSLLADLAAVQTFCKYVDSAWLRYNLPVTRIGLDEELAPATRRGWLVLEGDGGDDPFTRVGAAVERIRGQRPQMPSVVPG